MSSLDLAKFCSLPPLRLNLERPFSIGEYTFATDSRIIVRVPRIPDVAVPEDQTIAQKVLSLFADFDDSVLAPFTPVPLPAARTHVCDTCYGIGELKHADCPNCTGHTCHDCDGTGKGDPYGHQSGYFRGATFDLYYWSLLQELPGLCLPRTCHEQDPLPFSFDGGVGYLMPMLGKYAEHVNIEGHVAPLVET